MPTPLSARAGIPASRREHATPHPGADTIDGAYRNQPNLGCSSRGIIQMEITDVRVRRVNPDGKMKAIVSVTFDNEFVIHDIKVIECDRGLFIAMPSRKTSDGEFRDIAHPINSAARQRIELAVLEKYNSALGQTALISAV
jgi:stage V sporulation protein G